LKDYHLGLEPLQLHQDRGVSWPSFCSCKPRAKKNGYPELDSLAGTDLLLSAPKVGNVAS